MTRVTLQEYQNFVGRMINPNLEHREKLASYGLGVVGEAIEAWECLGTSLVLSASDDRNDAIYELGDYAHYLTGLYLLTDNSMVDSFKGMSIEWVESLRTSPYRDGLLKHGKGISEYIKKSQYHTGKPPISSFAMQARLDDALGHLVGMLPNYDMDFIEIISHNMDKLTKRHPKHG